MTDPRDSTISTLRATLEEAAGALKPFAKIGDVFLKADQSDDSIYTTIADEQRLQTGAMAIPGFSIAVGDLRRARSALAKIKEVIK